MIRIANCSGFYGDRISAAREMVEDGPIDVLTGDWLAELTMLILARTRAKQPGQGYARTFLTQMEQVMGTCLDRGIKVVSNAGGLDPASCADAVSEIAGRLGLSPTIAYVNGDDLMGRLVDLDRTGSLTHFETGESLGDLSRFITANAYLGCFGIVEALSGGADIVVTGRVTDAALVCGPAAWHHHWRRDNFDALAGGVVAGHVIECGAQVTGGNYSFFKEVPHMERVGFPWVEIDEDGSCVVGKHDGTGGEVSIGTVTSSCSTRSARRRTSDPTSPPGSTRSSSNRSTLIACASVASAARLLSTLKVAMNELGGYRKDLSVALTGLDIDEKADLVERAFWIACPFAPEDFESVTTRVVRTDKSDPPTNEEAVATWRVTLKDPDEHKVGRAVADAVVELALSTIPGFFIPGASPSPGSPYGVYRPALVPSNLVPQHVSILGGERTVIDSVAPTTDAHIVTNHGVHAAAPGGSTTLAPLGQVVGTRSGDKGGHANLGVFARSDEGFAWLDDFLTIDELKRLLPETAPLFVERFRLPALRSLNFLIHDLLDEGVAASTRQDAQAKGLGEWLRSRYVEVPASLINYE